MTFSKEAKKSAGTARAIKNLLGQAAYERYKKTGAYDAAALAAARLKKDGKTTKSPQKKSGTEKGKRVKPPPKNQLRAGAHILSSNSKRPGTIQSSRTLKGGEQAYLVKWDEGGMGVLTPDRIIVVKTAQGQTMKADSTGADDLYGKMQSTGLNIDTKGLRLKMAETTALIGVAQSTLDDLVNPEKLGLQTSFNPSSPTHVNAYLESIGKWRVRTIRDEVVGPMVPPDIAKGMSTLKQLKKRKQDFNTLLKNVGKDGKVHPRWVEAATGRWYTADPPIQTLAAAVREFIVPAPGHAFVTLDWHQHELRLLSKITGDPALEKIFENGADPHEGVFTKVTGEKLSEDPVARKKQRDIGKMLNYALVYGLGPEGLAGRLGVSVDRAKELIETHFERFPGMAKWIETTKDEAFKAGYITTLDGRKIPIDTDPYAVEGKAGRQSVNYTAQGSSADHLVDLLRRIDADGKLDPVLATIHDALLLQLPVDKIKELSEYYRQQMEAPYKGVVVPTDTNGPSVDWKSAMDGVGIDPTLPAAVQTADKDPSLNAAKVIRPKADKISMKETPRQKRQIGTLNGLTLTEEQYDLIIAGLQDLEEMYDSPQWKPKDAVEALRELRQLQRRIADSIDYT